LREIFTAKRRVGVWWVWNFKFWPDALFPHFDINIVEEREDSSGTRDTRSTSHQPSATSHLQQLIKQAIPGGIKAKKTAGTAASVAVRRGSLPYKLIRQEVKPPSTPAESKAGTTADY